MFFKNTKEKIEETGYPPHMLIPLPQPIEVAKIKKMLNQVETWINSGDTELAKKHWSLIADECLKNGTSHPATSQNH